MDRRTLLGLLAGAPLLACRWPQSPPDPPPDPVPEAVALACAWLAAAQAQDGRVPSATYGFMRVGHSTTALVAQALGALGPELPEAGRTVQARALDWLAGRLATGPLGLDGPALDYPVYATAMGLSALVAAGRGEGLEAAAAWLLDQQLLSGWEGHGAHGGFGMGRGPDQPVPVPPHPGHVDLSMTRRALQALAAVHDAGLAEAGRLDAALAAGAAFARRCRTTDGGFVYSPAELALNKSALVDGVAQAGQVADFRGYGSATADGVLALQAAGLPRTAAEIVAGLRWLDSHHRLDVNPGLDGAPIAAYGPAMRFYYRAAAAEAFAGGGPSGWQQALATALLVEQQPDGSWQSDLALQKEDDPVIATGLALLAFGFSRVQGASSPGVSQ